MAGLSPKLWATKPCQLCSQIRGHLVSAPPSPHASPPARGRGVSGEHPVSYLFFGSEENADDSSPAVNAVDRDSTTKMVSQWLGTRN